MYTETRWLLLLIPLYLQFWRECFILYGIYYIVYIIVKYFCD